MVGDISVFLGAFLCAECDVHFACAKDLCCSVCILLCSSAIKLSVHVSKFEPLRYLSYCIAFVGVIWL